jgi:hypothetical protein
MLTVVCPMLRINCYSHGNFFPIGSTVIGLSNCHLVRFTKSALAILYQLTIHFTIMAQKTKTAYSLLARTQLNVSRQTFKVSIQVRVWLGELDSGAGLGYISPHTHERTPNFAAAVTILLSRTRRSSFLNDARILSTFFLTKHKSASGIFSRELHE